MTFTKALLINWASSIEIQLSYLQGFLSIKFRFFPERINNSKSKFKVQVHSPKYIWNSFTSLSITTINVIMTGELILVSHGSEPTASATD